MTKQKLSKVLMTGVLIVGAVCWVLMSTSEPRASMTMASDKSEYHSDDDIVLTLKPDWARPLHKELRNSLSFYVHDSRSGAELFTSKAKRFSGEDPTVRDEEFEVWREDRSLQIRGRISSTGEQTSITFDGFGTFQISLPAILELSFWYSPLKPDPLDSLEDYSNEITISVVK